MNVQTFKQYLEEQNKLDQIQAALDVAGFEPIVGTTADAANTIISSLRAALSKEPDERKKHIINAGISAISLIPFADIIKLLKLRKTRPVAKLAVTSARGLKQYGKTQQMNNRFSTSINEESLHQWFKRNKGKGWINCKKSKPGKIVSCGRPKGTKGPSKGYPACRPTLSQCTGSKAKKKGPKRIKWSKKK